MKCEPHAARGDAVALPLWISERIGGSTRQHCVALDWSERYVEESITLRLAWRSVQLHQTLTTYDTGRALAVEQDDHRWVKVGA